MSDLKFCKDCKWLESNHWCGHKSAAVYNLVDGRKTCWSAQVQREGARYTDCGPEGKYWQAKDPVFDPTTILDLFHKKSFWQHLKGLLGGCPTGGGGP